ncbi:MAG: PAS domain-containing protein [Syntrophomonas sp.]
MLYKILNTAYIYQHIVESMHDGVFTIDNSGTIVTVNSAAAKILEKSGEEILDKKFPEVFVEYPENDDFNQVVLDAVYKSFMSHHKICAYYTGKTLKYLFVTTSLLKITSGDSDKTVGVIVVFSDITELQKLREAEVTQKIKKLSWNLE